jgi:hypothetical protein
VGQTPFDLAEKREAPLQKAVTIMEFVQNVGKRLKKRAKK